MQSKMMMKIVIGSEAMFFLCLIIAYLSFWKNGNFQPQIADHLDVKLTGLFTMCLIASSFTFWRAERSQKEGEQKKAVRWLLATLALGIIFLFGQGREYYNLIKENVTVNRNVFGSAFYTLTGFHGLHVLLGIVVLMIILLISWSQYFKIVPASVFKSVGMYWHFVDAVWIIVFTTIYLLPYLI
jgi:heme/copper-type cytochrome/quinol oxidase subunit 3